MNVGLMRHGSFLAHLNEERGESDARGAFVAERAMGRARPVVVFLANVERVNAGSPRIHFEIAIDRAFIRLRGPSVRKEETITVVLQRSLVPAMAGTTSARRARL